jgi:hypothetical protein
MTHDDPTNPHESPPARPVSDATSGPPVAGVSGNADPAPTPAPSSLPDPSASVITTEGASRSWRRRWLSYGRRGWIVAAALMVAVIGLVVALANSPSPTAAAASPPAAEHVVPGNGGGPGSGGQGSNARSGSAEGGAAGTVDSMSTSGFTMSMAAGQEVTVDVASSTTYLDGTSATTASVITSGDNVLVLGTTSGTSITATQVIEQPTDGGGAAASSAAGVIPFQRGAPSTSNQVGQIPADYTEGSGTIVDGSTADRGTEAALAAYPGGVVDRVVQLSDGEYEVHYIGVNWPHHIFVDQDFQVVGAN